MNVNNSRREEPPKRGRAPREPKDPREKAKHPILRALGRTLATLICLGIMVCSLAAVAAVYYAVQATANDGNLLDLDNIELSQSSTVVATDPDTGAQVEYATLRSSNSHRVWADLEQIPTNLQYAFICTEDKDFYNEPGVNSKRTIGAMINEYLLPIYSSKQGASTLEQQLIKNLTSDKSASGVEGALRKLREIYRALCLSRAYPRRPFWRLTPEHHQLHRHHSGRSDSGQRVFQQGRELAHPLGVRHHRVHHQEPHQLQPLHQPREPDPPPQLHHV